MTLHCRHYRVQWTRGDDVSSESRVTRKKITDSLLYVFSGKLAMRSMFFSNFLDTRA